MEILPRHSSTGNRLDSDIVFWDDTTISGNYVLHMGCGWHADECVVYSGKLTPEQMLDAIKP